MHVNEICNVSDQILTRDNLLLLQLYFCRVLSREVELPVTFFLVNCQLRSRNKLYLFQLVSVDVL